MAFGDVRNGSPPDERRAAEVATPELTHRRLGESVRGERFPVSKQMAEQVANRIADPIGSMET
jgi:hypothetical protein